MPRKSKIKFGKAFPDQLASVKISNKHFHAKDEISLTSFLTSKIEPESQLEGVANWRKLSIVIIFMLSFFSIFLRLFNLQVIYGNYNKQLADSNRIQIRIIHAPRGVIYDRNGKILAQNEPGFRLIIKDSKSAKPTITTITRDDALKMEINHDPNFNNLEVDNLRSYPQGEVTAHLLGYTSEINSDELNQIEFKKYRLGDHIGRLGVEQTYESFLKGTDGGEVIEYDASGKKVRTIKSYPAIPGQNLYLTIDSDLQKIAYFKLKEALLKADSCCGALIAENPSTGEILSLVSIPSFNPQEVNSSLSSPNSPFLDRVIAGTYPPGSTFKIASALTGLTSGKITPTTSYEDTGVINLGTFSFANWFYTQYGRTETGPIDITRALQRSNDIFFYRLGQLTGENALADTARDLGLGEKTGIDLPGEVTGLIPDSSWKIKTFNQPWYPGDTLHMVIGQGFVLTTPLQISFLISQIAENGKQFLPHLGLKIISNNGDTVIKQFHYDYENKTLKFKPADLALVRKGLEEVPKVGGTAWPFFTFPIPTAGKTGTAEFGDPHNLTHAWYTSYAPSDDAKIAVTALIEGGGEGSTTASPVVKEVLRYFLSPDKNNLIKDINPVASDSAKKLGE